MVTKMSPRINRESPRRGLLSLAAIALLIVGPSVTRAESSAASKPKGETFVVGTDAPLGSVASFTVTINSINAVDTTTNTSVPLFSGPETIDFARFNGLQTLLNINSVPVG